MLKRDVCTALKFGQIQPKLGISSSLPVADKGVVRAGLLLPLTGKNGKLGQDMLQAAKLAFFGFAEVEFSKGLLSGFCGCLRRFRFPT